MAYYCYNLQRWAGERENEVDEKIEAEAKITEANKANVAEQKRIADRNIKKAEDNKILSEDIQISQAALKVMRSSGFVEGVNPKKAKQKPPRASAVDSMLATDVEINLNPDVDWSKKRNKKDPMLPFDVNILVDARACRRLRGKVLGERGALSLAAEFLKGACPVLEVLDLRGCEVTCRGLGRIFHGLKLGNIVTIRELNLRGNFLRSHGLQYLQNAMEAQGIFDSLLVLDLRDNELGEEGVDVLIRMFIKGTCKTLTHIFLQRNGIGDSGFSKVVRTLQSMHGTRCPDLLRLGMEGNPISGKIKKQYWPLPLCLSV